MFLLQLLPWGHTTWSWPERHTPSGGCDVSQVYMEGGGCEPARSKWWSEVTVNISVVDCYYNWHYTILFFPSHIIESIHSHFPVYSLMIKCHIYINASSSFTSHNSSAPPQKLVQCHLEVLWGFKRNQVREELQQEHQRFLTGGMATTATTKTHLKCRKSKVISVNIIHFKLECAIFNSEQHKHHHYYESLMSFWCDH